jgi:hypothetical protein
VSHADFDDDIQDHSEDFEAAEEAMLAVVLAVIAGSLTEAEAQGQLELIAGELRGRSVAWAAEVLPDVYLDGLEEALGPREAEERLSNPLHQAFLSNASAGLVEALAGTTDQMTRDAKLALREIAREQIVAMMEGGRNAIPQAAEMSERLEERGVRFVDRSGRRWKPRGYSEMVLRDAATDLSNDANLNAADELGSPGVRVFDGGPGDTDEPCLIANNQAWGLSYARAHTREHNNCRRAFAPLPSTFSGRLDRE